MIKVCSKCNKEKDIEEFSIDRSRKDNHRYVCKICDNRQSKDYRINNKEKVLEKSKIYYKNNKERILNRLKLTGKIWYSRNRNKVSTYDKIHNNSSAKFNTYASQLDFCEEVRRDPNNEELLQVRCTYCGRWFSPTNRQITGRIRSLNNIGSERRLYCSNECKKLCPIFNKTKYSDEEYDTNKYSREVQPELRQLVFERDRYKCQRCESTKYIQCHHITGVEQNPIESADIDNCITLCKKCHKLVHSDIGCRYVDLRCN